MILAKTESIIVDRCSECKSAISPGEPFYVDLNKEKPICMSCIKNMKEKAKAFLQMMETEILKIYK